MYAKGIWYFKKIEKCVLGSPDLFLKYTIKWKQVDVKIAKQKKNPLFKTCLEEKLSLVSNLFKVTTKNALQAKTVMKNSGIGIL